MKNRIFLLKYQNRLLARDIKGTGTPVSMDRQKKTSSKKKGQSNAPAPSAANLDRPGDLMVSISGVRGRIPAGLDPLLVTSLAEAFATMSGKRIVIGRDSRPSGPALQDQFSGILQLHGKEVLDAGLAPTPTIKAAVRYLEADAGVIISASHNPMEWNGFKFLGKGGFFFDHKQGQKLREIVTRGLARPIDWRKTGSYSAFDPMQPHIDAVLAVLPNVERIRQCRFKVLVDAVDGAGRRALPMLLEQLGCQVEKLYCNSSLRFPRPPEPTPRALREFDRRLKSGGLDCGFALDPDADRLVTGSPGRGGINEEYTLPLAAGGLALPANVKQSMVVNLSTACLLDDVVRPQGISVHRSAVGEANVVAQMKKRRALFGGEGNGGVIHSAVPSFGRDSLLGAGLILSAMAKQGARQLDDLMDAMPPLFMAKEKLQLRPGQKIDRLFEAMQRRFQDARVDTSDGLYLHWSGGRPWIHLRASNTEPVVRLIAEHQSKRELAELLQSARAGLS
ncbi:MAG: phosphoglucosamine mutase [Leptospiraceae bacterium]|nr:phosphoglucosamine mutase [Leptospiraceae bacterium]